MALAALKGDQGLLCQHPHRHSGSQLPIALAQGDPTPSLASVVMCTHAHIPSADT